MEMNKNSIAEQFRSLLEDEDEQTRELERMAAHFNIFLNNFYEEKLQSLKDRRKANHGSVCTNSKSRGGKTKLNVIHENGQPQDATYLESNRRNRFCDSSATGDTGFDDSVRPARAASQRAAASFRKQITAKGNSKLRQPSIPLSDTMLPLKRCNTFASPDLPASKYKRISLNQSAGSSNSRNEGELSEQYEGHNLLNTHPGNVEMEAAITSKERSTNLVNSCEVLLTRLSTKEYEAYHLEYVQLKSRAEGTVDGFRGFPAEINVTQTLDSNVVCDDKHLGAVSNTTDIGEKAIRKNVNNKTSHLPVNGETTNAKFSDKILLSGSELGHDVKLLGRNVNKTTAEKESDKNDMAMVDVIGTSSSEDLFEVNEERGVKRKLKTKQIKNKIIHKISFSSEEGFHEEPHFSGFDRNAISKQKYSCVSTIIAQIHAEADSSIFKIPVIPATGSTATGTNNGNTARTRTRVLTKISPVELSKDNLSSLIPTFSDSETLALGIKAQCHPMTKDVRQVTSGLDESETELEVVELGTKRRDKNTMDGIVNNGVIEGEQLLKQDEKKSIRTRTRTIKKYIAETDSSDNECDAIKSMKTTRTRTRGLKKKAFVDLSEDNIPSAMPTSTDSETLPPGRKVLAKLVKLSKADVVESESEKELNLVELGNNLRSKNKIDTIVINNEAAIDGIERDQETGQDAGKLNRAVNECDLIKSNTRSRTRGLKEKPLVELSDANVTSAVPTPTDSETLPPGRKIVVQLVKHNQADLGEREAELKIEELGNKTRDKNKINAIVINSEQVKDIIEQDHTGQDSDKLIGTDNECDLIKSMKTTRTRTRGLKKNTLVGLSEANISSAIPTSTDTETLLPGSKIITQFVKCNKTYVDKSESEAELEIVKLGNKARVKNKIGTIVINSGPVNGIVEQDHVTGQDLDRIGTAFPPRTRLILKNVDDMDSSDNLARVQKKQCRTRTKGTKQNNASASESDPEPVIKVMRTEVRKCKINTSQHENELQNDSEKPTRERTGIIQKHIPISDSSSHIETVAPDTQSQTRTKTTKTKTNLHGFETELPVDPLNVIQTTDGIDKLMITVENKTNTQVNGSNAYEYLEIQPVPSRARTTVIKKNQPDLVESISRHPSSLTDNVVENLTIPMVPLAKTNQVCSPRFTSPCPAGELVKMRVEEFERRNEKTESRGKERPKTVMTRTKTRALTSGDAESQQPVRKRADARLHEVIATSEKRATPLSSHNRNTAVAGPQKMQLAKPLLSSNKLCLDTMLMTIGTGKFNSEMIEQKKKKDEIKRRDEKEQEAIRKKGEKLKATAEEARRKREERIMKVAAAREAADREKLEIAERVEKEREEKARQAALEREARHRDEVLKRRQAAERKAQETEERRRYEEEQRIFKLKEEQKRVFEEKKEQLAAERLQVKKKVEETKQKEQQKKLAKEKPVKEKTGVCIDSASSKPLKMNNLEETYQLGNDSNYNVTPAREDRIPLPSKTANDYGIEDVGPSDSSEDEKKPKKIIPFWAQEVNRERPLKVQYYLSKEEFWYRDFWGSKERPDIIFKELQRRVRTSSAVWEHSSPL